MKEQAFFTISWKDEKIIVLDQRLLPTEEKYVELGCVEEVHRAIRNMVVRGAPLIGVTAAYGVALAAVKASRGRVRSDVKAAVEFLKTSRPTAVNLFWALERMERVLQKDCTEEDLVKCLVEEARLIEKEDVESNQCIGEFGAELLKDGFRVLTHCNAGALATAGWGTALGVVRSAVASGKRVHVYADETRPVLQGARLTAWELMKDGIPVTLIPDNAAAFLMEKGRVDCVIVGADRIAANGDVANKIGTLKLAIAARYYDIPFYVAAPRSTIDYEVSCGEEIPIEERSPDEVKNIATCKIAPCDVGVWNPAFDVTPAELVTAIVTDYGVLAPPFEKSIERIRYLER